MPDLSHQILVAALLVSLAAGCRCGAEEVSGEEQTQLTVLDVPSAIFLASMVVDTSLERSTLSTPDDIRRHFDEALESGDPLALQTALRTLPPGVRSPEDFERQVAALAALGRPHDVRAAAISRALRHPDNSEARAEASRLWVTAPELGHEVTTWDTEAGRYLELFHGSSSIIFKWRTDQTVFASFKPRQSIRRQYYRSEVATDRLAYILGLDVTVPQSREVRIGWEDFHELSGIEVGDNSFHDTSAQLEWLGEGNERYLMGVSKTWIRTIERFPVEYTDIWTPWLDGTRDVEWLRTTSVVRAVSGLQGRPRDHYEQVTKTVPRMRAFQLAHQLSDLHVLDVLVNNYDRYQPEGVQLGMNCHLSPSGLVSLDNGAGFPTRADHDWRRVRSKIESITRFSRSTYQLLSALDPEELRAALFTDAPSTDQEDDRYEYFVERWNWMRSHIDERIAEHGENAVLIFP